MLQPQASRRRATRAPLARSLFRFLLVSLFLTLGSPILVAAAPARQAAPPAPPKITAPAAIVVEYPSGKILYAKNIHERHPEASTTKTMTALLTLQRVSLTDVVTATAADLVGESTMGLVEGEQQTVLNLLYGLLLPSGNDAAMVLARHVGSGLKEPVDADPVERFVALMNRQAQQMGLTDTHFMNPHGFDDPNHYSSAYDLASIAWYDLHNPTFNDIVRQSYHEVPGHALYNTDDLLTQYQGADGVKTGWTDIANNCFIGSATRNGRRLITVTLDDPHGYTWPDNTALLDYGFSVDSNTATDTLTIARRAELLWYLAEDLPTPLPTPRPTATATPASTGFSLPFLGPAATATPNAATLSIASAAGPAPGPAPAGPPAWIWSLLAVPVGGLLVLLSWQRLPRRRPALAPRPGGRMAPVPPRITLMNSDDARTRAERAVALAYRGQEGASLAEFMLVVKSSPDFEFGRLPGFYDMPAAGYLALARAYLEHDRRAYAAALIHLGLETYKDDKPLARMLKELEEPPAADAAGAEK